VDEGAWRLRSLVELDSLLRARGLTSQQIAHAMTGDLAVAVLRGSDCDEVALLGVVAVATAH